MRSTAAVTAVINLDNLRSGASIGWLDEENETFSAATNQQLCRVAGFAPLLLGDNGDVLNLRRDRRLVTPAWVTVRDGGCANCGAPASLREALHAKRVEGRHGATDMDNGKILNYVPSPYSFAV
jgi:hypothetical protein